MADLSDSQFKFVTTYLGSSKRLDTAKPEPDLGSYAARIKSTLAMHPQAKAVLVGLLKAASDAQKSQNTAEVQRQLAMLQERLDALDGAPPLPDLKSILEVGLAKASQSLLPEDPTMIFTAYEAAQAEVQTLPAGIRDAALRFTTELNQLRARGDQLVARLKKGDLPPTEAAAHHSEVDQICVRLEDITADLHKVLQSEGAI